MPVHALLAAAAAAAVVSTCILATAVAQATHADAAVSAPPTVVEAPPLTNSRYLGDGVQLSWGADAAAASGDKTGIVTFQLEAPTTGWVGLGFSPNGGMVGADVSMSWVDDDDGSVHVTDRFASSNQVTPPLDASQDLTAISGSQNSTHTTIRFARRMTPCDPDNLPIAYAGTTRILYSFGQSDALQWHGDNRGSVPMLLVGRDESADAVPLGDDVYTADVTIGGVGFGPGDSGYSDSRTSYHCAGVEMPVPEDGSTHHLVRVEPLITPAALKYVHHILLYWCPGLTAEEADFSDRCYSSDMPPNLEACNFGTVAMSWAVGGDPLSMPQEAGVPINEAAGRYALMEIHYDNPGHEGFYDDSGFRMYLTPTLRTHDAGIMTLGHLVVSQSMKIPPRQARFAIDGWCPAACTDQMVPDDGINIVATFLHAHIAGTAIRLRHIRDGQELEPIAREDYYDFNYQTMLPSKNHRNVQQGDTLLTTCVYNTTDRSYTTSAGLSTTQEMCLSYVLYYPLVDYSVCGSVNGRLTYGFLTGVQECTGSEVASCSSDGVSDILSTKLVSAPEKSFQPYREEVCGVVVNNGELPNLKRQPVCGADDDFHGTGPAEINHVNSACIGDMCAATLARCEDDADCAAALACVLQECQGDMSKCEAPETGTAACDVSALEPLSVCAQRFCGLQSECSNCAGCALCFGDGTCAGSNTGDCAACRHCHNCEPCLESVDDRETAHACLANECEDEFESCGPDCVAALDCVSDCVHDATRDAQDDGGGAAQAQADSMSCTTRCGAGIVASDGADSASTSETRVLDSGFIEQFVATATCASQRACVPGLEADEVAAAQTELSALMEAQANGARRSAAAGIGAAAMAAVVAAAAMSAQR